MIKSMTAFARLEEEHSIGLFSCEIRSINHRYLETSLRIPDEFRQLENQLRDIIRKKLSRGKIDCSIKFRNAGNVRRKIEINEPLAEAIIHQCQHLSERIFSTSPISAMDILRWPGVVKEDDLDLSPAHKPLLDLLNNTLDSLMENREREGQAITDMVSHRCATIITLAQTARLLVPEIVERFREKMRKKIAEVAPDLDHQRLEQEIALLAQKMDVDEEIDRLQHHVEEVLRTLTLNEPAGRRLDFLMQELNREANTLGSKSNDSATTKISVDLKVLIEQIREQIQNIE